MLLTAYIFLASATVAETTVLPMKAPIVGPIADAGPAQDIHEPPPAQTIDDIERFSLALPWKFEPNGGLRTPAVELAEISCAKSAFRHFACKYDIRVREFGETEFGPWHSRRKVFTQLGHDWVMLNAEERCSNIDPKNLPDYCFPKE